MRRRLRLPDPNLLFSLLTQIANKAPALVSAMILTRVFPMAEMGGFFFASAYTYVFALLVTFGTNMHLVRAVAEDPERGIDRLGEVLALRLPLMLAALVLMNGLAYGFAPDLFAIMLLTSLYYLLGDLCHSFGAYLTGLRQFRLRLLIASSGPLFLIISVSIAVLAGATLAQTLLCYVAASAFMLFISIVVVRRRFGSIPLPRGGAVLKRIMLLCWPLLLLDALQIVQFKVDTLMIYLLVSADAVAEYETAYRLLEVTRLGIRPLVLVAFPLCVALAKDDQWTEVTHLLLKTVALAAVAGIILALLVGIAPETIMALVWGQDYRSSGSILQVLFYSAPLLLVGVVCASLANAIHLERTLIVIMSVAAVLNLALNFWAIPIWGATGAAWTTLVTEAVIALCLALVWRRTLVARARAADENAARGGAS
jgi:PST family polysaccharide transporter